MSSVVFSHTKSQEKEYLRQLLLEKQWFERANFSVFLPKDNHEIESEIRKREQLVEQVLWLKNEWKKIEKEYFNTVKKFKQRKLLRTYRCHVSRFGPEGKYRRPNFLFVRLRTSKDKQRVIETIGHELLHLLFADFFESKKFNYSEREGMTDALILQSDLARLFPRYQQQSIGRVRPRILKSILAST